MDARIDYHPLPEPDSCLRLIKLHPPKLPKDAEKASASLDILECDIELHFRGDSPGYMALSYAWGPFSNEKEHVLIDGKEVQISRVVENALRHLRASGEARWIWVDQLCINQVDDVEKSHQVQQMHNIYSEADQTIAWLGLGDEGSDLIMDLMRKIGQAILSKDFTSLKRICSGDGDKESFDLAAAAEAFHHFCRRDYWSRIWVMQEFAVGRRVSVACGDSFVDSDLIFTALYPDEMTDDYSEKDSKLSIREVEKLQAKISPLYGSLLLSYVNNLFTRRDLFRGPSTEKSSRTETLLKVVATSLVFEEDYNWVYASDPRDRIFALLNLADDKDDFTAFPDYTMTVEEVYKETARRILQQGHIDVLMYCQYPKKITSLPSWVPDWSMEVRHPVSQPPWSTSFQASRKKTAVPQFTAEDRLILEGIHVDTIKETGLAWDPDWLKPFDKVAAAPYLRSIKGFCNRSPRIRVGDESSDAARIALLDGPSWNDGVPLHQWGQICFGGMHSILEDPETQVPEGSEAGNASEGSDDTGEWEDDEDSEDVDEGFAATGDSWYGDTLRWQHARRCFVTTTGYVGVGPLGLQAGDEVCVFLGGKTVYIVRPQDDDTYLLIGEGYAHGVMYGELLKGGSAERKEYTLK
ncbi:hypothetical protein FZEAL_6190 [Fusarium zealandicum]|uniref:Heterokaryon incompatibility domain-containing protein n=1 Tax=Fusarium zealandicum TaxID=1053134 RepID=A0A8H4UIL9_9HYPO|nr:hypothetical protein FZEAL_6190 [Fusarium zealandicum]